MVTMEETDDFYFKVMKITMKICLRFKWVFKSCVVVSRQGVSIPQVEAPVPDLLGSILSGQSMLLMDSSDVVINRDGSLKATKPGESCFGYIYIYISAKSFIVS